MSRSSDPRSAPRASAVLVSPFRRLARTHALVTMGDATMYGALAGSVLFSLSADAQRQKVLLYLLISVAPFALVAPAIGPTLDRIPGGRRMVIQITAAVRAGLYVVMAFHVNDLLLYPLIFLAMVMQKTYTVSKSALVPSLVRTDDELVEANSKLSLIAGIVGVIAIAPAAAIGKVSEGVALFLGAGLFVVAIVFARRLPKAVVAAEPPLPAEKSELRSAGILLAAGAMTLIRAAVGFLAFELFFWLRDDYGLFEVGLAVAFSAVGSMLGNLVAGLLRRALQEERLLTLALGVIAVAGAAAAATGGLFTALMLALVVNFSAAVGRLAFDAIVQRDAPDANQGRAFARYEARFQLAWVIAAIVPVAYTLPGQVGFFVIALMGGFGMTTYVLGWQAVRAGRPLPRTLTQRARMGLAANVAKRRGNTPAKGERRITPDPRDRERRAPLPPPTGPPRGGSTD